MSDPAASFDVDPAEISVFARDRYGARLTGEVDRVGNGSWSRCYGLTVDGARLVLKVSPHLDDLERDRVAANFARPGLPVPQIVDHGEAFGMHFTLAELVPGGPLEHVSSDVWATAVPSVVDALDVMRMQFDGLGSGWGGWDATGVAAHLRWRSFLLHTLVDRPGERVSGWLAKLDSRPHLRAAFEAAVVAIDELASDDVPRGLLHCDLLYGNAHVHAGRLAGVFDWGCSIYGDPLTELGWFEFWAPWYPSMDASLLLSEAARRSPESDVTLHGERWLTVLLWIGATHLAYQAFADLWDDAEATARRMHHLADQFGRSLTR